MILMSHHQHYDTPADEARVTTTTTTTTPTARAAVTPPDGMTLLPSDFNPGKSDVSKVVND